MKKAIIHQHYPLDYAGEEALNSICTNLAFIGTDKRKNCDHQQLSERGQELDDHAHR